MHDIQPTEDPTLSDGPAAVAIATTIQTAWESSMLRTRRTATPHDYVYASGNRPCVRRMTYELTVPQEQPPYSADTLAKFRRGEDRERDLLMDLTRIGRDSDPPFKVLAQQERFTLRGRGGRTVIVGKTDARLQVEGQKDSAPVEVKAWSPYLTERIRTFGDLYESPYTRSGADQLLAYLYGAGERFGFLVLDRSGLPLVLPVVLVHYLDRVEEFLTRAETALAHVDAGTLPDYLQGDPAECQRCPFYGSTCNPPLDHPGAVVLADPELESLLEERDRLRPIGQEYERLDRKVKDRLRGIEHGVCGPFAINGTWGKQSKLDLPEDLRKQYTRVDPHGRFTLDIVRL